MRTSKVYPYRIHEKLLAGLLLAALPIGFLPSQPITLQHADGAWRVCLEIGFIPSWYHCWTFGGQLEPDVPPGCCSDTCVGPCQ